MIQRIRCNTNEQNIAKRKQLKKKGFISSALVSKKLKQKGVSNRSDIVRSMVDVCKDSVHLQCVELITQETTRRWYLENQVEEIVKEISDGKRKTEKTNPGRDGKNGSTTGYAGRDD